MGFPIMLIPAPVPLIRPISPKISKLRKAAYWASIRESLGTTMVSTTKKNRILLPLNFSLAKEYAASPVVSTCRKVSTMVVSRV